MANSCKQTVFAVFVFYKKSKNCFFETGNYDRVSEISKKSKLHPFLFAVVVEELHMHPISFFLYGFSITWWSCSAFPLTQKAMATTLKSFLFRNMSFSATLLVTLTFRLEPHARNDYIHFHWIRLARPLRTRHTHQLGHILESTTEQLLGKHQAYLQEKRVDKRGTVYFYINWGHKNLSK